MLSSIHIENIAVIKKLDIEFSPGFCAFTGETGAGKTVIMDAIKLLAGAKTDRDLIRRGENRAEISGVFTNISDEISRKLAEMGYECEDGELLVSRYITSDGRSGVKINGRSATSAIQKSIVGSLLDFHGQHDSMTLLDKKTHIQTLDRYSECDALLEEYREKYAHFTEARSRYTDFISKEREREREYSLLLSEIKEIEAVKPKAGEEEALEAQRTRLSSIEKIKKQAGFAYKALYGGERGNASMLIDKSIESLEGISDVVGEVNGLVSRLRDIYYDIEDISDSVRALYASEDGDPTAMLDKIESRLDAYQKLKRKYGSDVPEILSYLDSAKKKVSDHENADAIKEELEKECKALYVSLRGVADALSEKRSASAKQLSVGVAEVLDFLDMPKVRFYVDVIPRPSDKKGGEFTPDGADDVVFSMSLSPAEPPIELSNASGGELARVMLALKSTLSEKYGVATVIYDEIDAGVSGKTARKIGIKLKGSSAAMQVICVTHSAQIASLADTHYKIVKNTDGDRFESGVISLDRDGRINELSRILGGLNVTSAQKQAARDMLEYEGEL